jgi:type IV secretory pathway TraG/TraD family ATPase VirD4
MATIKEILDSRFFGEEGGIFLGRHISPGGQQHDVHAFGDSNLSIIAPPGSQRTMSIIVPAVLNAATFRQNLILNDSAGEILFHLPQGT